MAEGESAGGSKPASFVTMIRPQITLRESCASAHSLAQIGRKVASTYPGNNIISRCGAGLSLAQVILDVDPDDFGKVGLGRKP